jgi:hypothetical protein
MAGPVGMNLDDLRATRRASAMAVSRSDRAGISYRNGKGHARALIDDKVERA